VGEKADLEAQAVEALHRYREALARAEDLERQEATAHRALVDWQGHVKTSIFEGPASLARSHLVQTGQAAVSRLHEVRLAMSEATAALRLAFEVLVAFDDALGYIPIPARRVRRRCDSSSRRRKGGRRLTKPSALGKD
jgi:hypothetical protein